MNNDETDFFILRTSLRKTGKKYFFQPPRKKALTDMIPDELNVDEIRSQDKQNFIDNYGSERLRLGIKYGYNMNGVYLDERTALAKDSFIESLSKYDCKVTPSPEGWKKEDTAVNPLLDELKLLEASFEFVEMNELWDDNPALVFLRYDYGNDHRALKITPSFFGAEPLYFHLVEPDYLSEIL